MKHTKNQVHKWNTADSITAARMALSLILLVPSLRSAGFLAVYTLAGLTDTLDGWLARKTGTASDFGARLDSIADLLFFAVLFFRISPLLWRELPVIVWYAAAVILLVRLAAFSVAAIRYRRFAALHTWLNKLTGVGIFLLPYAFAVSAGVILCLALCVIALAASLEELIIHLSKPGYQADRKSLFQ